MIVIWQEHAFLVPEEDNTVLAAQELAEYLEEELTDSVGGGYLIAEEEVEFLRTSMAATRVRCLGPIEWRTRT